MPGRPGRVNCGVCHRQHDLPSCQRPLIDRLAGFTDEELEDELERRSQEEASGPVAGLGGEDTDAERNANG